MIFKTVCLICCVLWVNVVEKVTGSVERADLQSLRLVHAVWRHGDRTPSTFLPNEESTWSLGLGELTEMGIKQEFALGQFLKERYDGFVKPDYSPFEIYVRSSDYNRTLASGQAVMSGMFPVESGEIWRPIPVHSIPKKMDNLLYDRCPCPVAEYERRRVYNEDPEILKHTNDNMAMLRYIGEKAGFSQVPLSFRDVWMVYDPLLSRSRHNDTQHMPAWVNSTVQKEIWRLYDLSSKYLFHTELLKRLRGGSLFADILRRMQLRQHGDLDPRLKFYAFSGHDTAIAALLSVFGITLEIFPDYSTALFVELHEINSDFVVKLFYKNNTDGSIVVPLAIPGCPEPCPLSQLAESRQFLIPDDWEQECGLKHWYDFGAHAYLLLVSFLLLISVAEGVALVVKCSGKRRSNSYELKADPSVGASLLYSSDEDSF